MHKTIATRTKTGRVTNNTGTGCQENTIGQQENRDNQKFDISENHLYGHKTSGTTTVKPKRIETRKMTQITQTEPQGTTTGTQTTSNRNEDTAENCVSRMDPNICIQEIQTHNVEPPTMGTITQLEASHEMITQGLVATVEKTTITIEAEEDTPLFRQRLQRVLGVRFIDAATKKDRSLRQLFNFVKKRDWEAIKASYGQYWHNIRNRLYVREDCLPIDERIVIPTQLRQTVLDSLHLTQPESKAMRSVSACLVSPHSPLNCANGTEMPTLHQTR